MDTAQKIANRVSSGCDFETIRGTHLGDLCERLSVTEEYANQYYNAETGLPDFEPVCRNEDWSAVRYEFKDGSAIVFCETAWDIEGDEPFSWESC